MTPDITEPFTTRDRLLVLAMAVVAVLIAAPGVHLFELWLPHAPAVYISHGLAVLGLVAAFWQWRARSRRAAHAPRA